MDMTASIDEMIIAQARCFAQLQANVASLTGEQRRRADRLISAMNGIHTAAEGMIAALGRTAPDIQRHMAAPSALPGGGARETAGASGAALRPVTPAAVASTSAPVFDGRAIFEARRAAAGHGAAVEASTTSTSAPSALAPSPACAVADPGSVYARRAQQRTAPAASEAA